MMNTEMNMNDEDVQTICNALIHSEAKFVDTLWAYLENGLLTKEQFRDVMRTSLEMSYSDGIDFASSMFEQA
jgi:hypothetical protein